MRENAVSLRVMGYLEGLHDFTVLGEVCFGCETTESSQRLDFLTQDACFRAF